MRIKQEVASRYAPPFLPPIGERLGNAFYSHNKVREMGDDWVLKTLQPLFRQGNWMSKVVEDYRLLQQFLRSFVPPTYFVEGPSEQNEREFFVVEKRIHGRPLQAYSYDELRENPRILEELDEFTYEVLLMYQSTGRMPDLHGSPQISRQYDFKSTEHVIFDPSGKLWLTDVDMVGPLWSPKWIGGKLHMQHHARSIQDFRERLNLDEVEKHTYAVGHT